jgi:hypothetical protein
VKRAFFLVLVAAVALASAALAAEYYSITGTSIGKGRLGQTRSAYKKAYGKPIRTDRLEGGLTRLVYPRRVEVYFKTGGTKGRYIVATSKLFVSAAGIGPCSSAADLKSAFTSAVKVPLAGGEYAYRLGKELWFEVESGKVAAVALGTTKQAAWIASNSVPCGS